MEVLNALITEADRRVVFSPLPAKMKNHASIYADDLVIFLSPNVQDFINIRRILDLWPNHQRGQVRCHAHSLFRGAGECGA
jgi:hypothetical protein